MAFEEKDEEVNDRELTVPLFTRPEFKAYISEDDVDTLAGRDKKVLLALSLVSQFLDWNTTKTLENNKYNRELERDLIKLRRFKDRFVIKLSTYVSVAVFLGGLLSLPVGWILKWIWSQITHTST